MKREKLGDFSGSKGNTIILDFGATSWYHLFVSLVRTKKYVVAYSGLTIIRNQAPSLHQLMKLRILHVLTNFINSVSDI